MTKDQKFSRAIICLLAVLAILVSAPAAYAQAANSEATAVTIGPMSVVKVEDLNYGNLIAGTTAGTMTVNTANGNVNVTGGVVRAGGGTSRANFIIYGPQNQIVRIRIPSTILINRNGGGANMRIDQMSVGNANRSLGTNVLGRLSTTGVFNLTVGGRLRVNANQQEGGYTGTFDMTVDYF
ncbi:MAG: hypothetical protein Pars2KO_13990 [Parasphingorhabdus sp.]